MEINKIKSLIQVEHIIYTIRGVQVMLDRDLAILYDVETRRLNEQVKRNKDRFPNHFMFVITDEEWQNLMSQNATSSLHGGRRKNPAVFTEQGVAMLSAVLSSKKAIEVSIAIMDAFVQYRKVSGKNKHLKNSPKTH
jgi:hypothetical protein